MKQIAIPHGGSMRFWGEWFGRPMDNYHLITEAFYDNNTNVLTIHFDAGETCIVYGPIGILSTGQTFHVENAARVVWSYPYYGSSQTSEVRAQLDYVREYQNSVICTITYGEQIRTKRLYPEGNLAVEIC